jgi:hypothetical protein
VIYLLKQRITVIFQRRSGLAIFYYFALSLSSKLCLNTKRGGGSTLIVFVINHFLANVIVLTKDSTDQH